MRGVIHGVLLGLAFYCSIGLIVLAARTPVDLGEFAFFKQAAR